MTHEYVYLMSLASYSIRKFNGLPWWETASCYSKCILKKKKCNKVALTASVVYLQLAKSSLFSWANLTSLKSRQKKFVVGQKEKKIIVKVLPLAIYSCNKLNKQWPCCLSIAKQQLKGHMGIITLFICFLVQKKNQHKD